jgi:RHS repeat-associated protein
VYDPTTNYNPTIPPKEYSFDAWGRRRSASDWSYAIGSEPALFADRGFTGHEYLSWFKLYNMNGRMYDPLVGRFLNADPYVQMPDNTQSYNRYSYCLNNPLKYTDPDGKWFFSLIFPGVGTVIDIFLWSATIDYATQAITNYVTNKEGNASDWLWKDIDWLDVGVSGVAGVATMGLDKIYKAHKISKPLFTVGKAAIDFGLPALSARYDWNPASDKEKFSVNRGSDFWTEYTFTIVKQKVATKNTDGIIDGLFGDKPWILNNPLKGELWKKALDIPASVFFGWWSDKATQPELQVPIEPQEIPNPSINPNWMPKYQNFNPSNDQDNLYQISNSLKLCF